MNAFKGIVAHIRKFGVARAAMLGGVALGMLAAFIWLEVQGPPPGRMRVVASDLDAGSARTVTDEFDKRKIPYRLDGTQLLVAETQLATARSILSAKGISGEGLKGYEIFDQGSSLTMTDFDQQIRLTRALEGELARTLEQVRGISRARVHLVLPKREPFMRERQDAQASVMLTFAGQQSMTAEAAQSVVNLVAAGVPGLKPQNITVVDSNLHLLVQAGDLNDPRLKSAKAEEQRQRLETRLSQEVELMLERSLGVGHVRAEASIQMNFDTISETQEHFDPDSPVIRSAQNVTSNNKSTEKNGTVSVQNNLPNADAGNQSTGSQESRQEETTNYEISKTVRAVVHDQPRIERISLAVMVDGVDAAGPDGKHEWHPRDQGELDRIQALVRTAIGYDEKRGDHVEVVSMPFTNDVEATAPAPVTRTTARNNDLLTFLQVIGFGVVGFGIIILTARSIYGALNRAPSAIVADGAPGLIAPEYLGLAQGGAVPMSTMIGQDGAVTTGQIGHDSHGQNGHGAIAVNQVSGSVHVASIRRVTELAESQPENALAIIRRWMAVEQQGS
jgi:flagellar M-ring protein FliF